MFSFLFRSMSSPTSSNTGSVDLESVLNVRRRSLASTSQTTTTTVPARYHHRYTDTIYLTREDPSNSVLSIQSKLILYGELQFLCSIFERYTSNIVVFEESVVARSHKTSFSTTFEENEEESEESATSSPRRLASISSPSSSPPLPARRRNLSSIGRSHTIASTTSDYTPASLEGKRYGSIQLPSMTIIEILEILLRIGLELVDVSSDYDRENVLHQNFVFSKSHSNPTKFYSRSTSVLAS